MLCQNCNKREAVNNFVVNYMGTEHEVHLCEECTAQAKQYMAAMYQHYGQNPSAMMGGWPQAQTNQRPLGQHPFPDAISEDIKSRRQINALRSQLQEAVEKEQYEKAAVLRDRIKDLEKDVCVHEL